MSARFKMADGGTAAAVECARLVVLVACVLSACATSPQPPGPAPQPAALSSPQAGPQPFTKHEGRPFDVQSEDSLLTILAFRGGTLGKAGHNHVIASHDITGTIYVPDDIGRLTFELHVPVAQLTIDEAELRAKEGADFPPDVPDAAKQGTRRNMLGEALLNAAAFPEIVLTSGRIVHTSDPSQVQIEVSVMIRGQMHPLTVPVRFDLQDDRLTATSVAPVKQSELGLTPFSALLGALQVQDEMQVRISIHARPARVQGAGNR